MIYHIFNRGVWKNAIYLNKQDYDRFLHQLLVMQFNQRFDNIRRHIQGSTLNKVKLEDRLIELLAFCLMPNHFHLLARQLKEGGISKYMQKIQTGYSMYFNKKHESSGHVFQGRYKKVPLSDINETCYVSAYIHRNPDKLKGKTSKGYIWSSYQDYLFENRWPELLNKELVLSEFNNPKHYQKYVETVLIRKGMELKA